MAPLCVLFTLFRLLLTAALAAGLSLDRCQGLNLGAYAETEGAGPSGPTGPLLPVECRLPGGERTNSRNRSLNDSGANDAGGRL